MRLLNIRLDNFQKIKEFEASPKAQNADIYGANGAGKTTIGSALMWLFTGKSIFGATLDPKPFDRGGDTVHGIDSSVEAALELGDGRMVTFKRTQHEVWKKRRGSQKEEYSGNETMYEVDGVPSKEKDYLSAVEKICPLDKIPLLMLPRYFATALHWKERREILLNMCGNITDNDVLDSDFELGKELPMYLLIPGTTGQRLTVDQFREKATASKKRINDQLKILPARMDEAQKAIQELTSEDNAALKMKPFELLSQKNTLLDEISHLEQGNDSAAASQIAELGKQLADEKAKLAREQSESVEQKRAAVRKLQAKQDEIWKKSVSASREAGTLLSDVKQMEQRREQLIKDYQILSEKYKAKVAEEYRGDTICPTCGQPLPEEKIEEARENFNRAKSQYLEDVKADMTDVNAKGKQECDKETISTLRKQAKAKLDEANDFKAQSAALDEKIKAAQVEVNSASMPPESSYASEIQKQINALRQKGEQANEPIRTAIADKQAEIDAIQLQLKSYDAAASKKTQNEKQEKRIAELKAEQKKYTFEYENLEHGLYLCEKFTRAKVNLLDERINSRFHSVRFRLFEQQVNGGLKDCCDVMVPSEDGSVLTPFGDDHTNKAAQATAGIEIIETLAAYWKTGIPIIMDDAEGVSAIPKTSLQLIRLIVSKPDKQLRVEIRTTAEDVKESA